MQALDLIHRNAGKCYIIPPDKLVGNAAGIEIFLEFLTRNDDNFRVRPTAKIPNHMREVIRVVAVQNGVKKKYAVFHRQ